MATLNVTTTSDEVDFANGALSLREAIILANQTGDGSTRILLSAGTYALGLAGQNEDSGFVGDLDVRAEISIEGAGADKTVIDAAKLDRVFTVHQGGFLNAVGVTISGGSASFGAGIYNQDTLVLRNCVLQRNSASSSGGGISHSAGVTWIVNSTLTENTANSSVGGALKIAGGVVEILNTTIAGNSARFGGAIYRSTGELHLNFSTIAGNKANYKCGGVYAGADVGATYIDHTVIANNQAWYYPDVYGEFISEGFNFIQNYSGSNGLNTKDGCSGNARLLPLTLNGGTTPTMAPDSGSPLVNGGNPNIDLAGVSTDQRGHSRLRGLRVDIGAFEVDDPDEDSDGMPDAWELDHETNPSLSDDAQADNDRDGQSNLSEYLADTDPNESASVFQVGQVTLANGRAVIKLSASGSRRYRLQALNPTDGKGWTDVDMISPLHSGEIEMICNDATGCVIYRVTAEMP